jgi:hypothetical protein
MMGLATQAGLVKKLMKLEDLANYLKLNSDFGRLNGIQLPR